MCVEVSNSYTAFETCWPEPPVLFIKGRMALLQGSGRVFHTHTLYKRRQNGTPRSSSLLLEVGGLEGRRLCERNKDAGEGVHALKALKMLDKAAAGGPVTNPQRASPRVGRKGQSTRRSRRGRTGRENPDQSMPRMSRAKVSSSRGGPLDFAKQQQRAYVPRRGGEGGGVWWN